MTHEADPARREAPHPTSIRVSIVIPARDEGAGLIATLNRIFESVTVPCEVLIVYDEPSDSTPRAIESVFDGESRIRPCLNLYGRGPANAIRYGIDQSRADVIVVTMADGADDPMQIDPLTRLVERGVAVAAASRYMPGGQQVGGPALKNLLSRLAGLSLYHLCRIGTRDATNSFKAYSRSFVDEVGIDSRHGFEIGLELTAKAKRLRRPIAEIPTIWLDRQSGVSNFKLMAWIPHYLRWYCFAFGPLLTLEQMRAMTADETAR
jgi:dolichol-phosphate mannosyltransferase